MEPRSTSGLGGLSSRTEAMARHPTCGYGFGSRVRHCFDRHVA